MDGWHSLEYKLYLQMPDIAKVYFPLDMGKFLEEVFGCLCNCLARGLIISNLNGWSISEGR